MAQNNVINTTSQVNTLSTYRLAGSCSPRAYVACDDTPYHLEKPVTVELPHTHRDAALVEKLAALRASSAGYGKSYRTLKALIDTHPDATAAELVNLLNQ